MYPTQAGFSKYGCMDVGFHSSVRTMSCMYFETCSGELDANMDDDSSDDSDSIIEENSDDETAPIATTPTATTTRSIDDMKIEGYEINEQPRNGIINHNNNMKKKFSILSKAGMIEYLTLVFCVMLLN